MSEIEALRRRNVELLNENRDLKRRIAQENAEHAKAEQILLAQRNEGLTPELFVLRRELVKWKDRAISAESRLAETRKVTR